MESNPGNEEAQTPDLATILRTLAALTPQNHTQLQAQPPSQPPPQAVDPRLSYHQTPQNQQVPPQPWPRYESVPQPQRSTTPPGPPPVVPTKHVDPATIITWKEGLRCASKIVNQPNFYEEIRRMIKVQNEHELQWFKGREALIEKQKARKEGQKKLDEVLKAVGGTVSGGGSNNTSPEELARELETFDMKVYKAQMQMTREMSNKLRSLGVPFFGTRSDLVRPAAKGETPASTENIRDGKAMIDEIELVKLQRQMLEHLEIVCND